MMPRHFTWHAWNLTSTFVLHGRRATIRHDIQSGARWVYFLNHFRTFFPSNAFMAFARSLHTFNRGKQLNCSLHAGLSPCRKPQKCRLWTSTQSRNCPSKRTSEQESKPKTTQQKQEKHTTKNKTKQKRQREVGSQPMLPV